MPNADQHAEEMNGENKKRPRPSETRQTLGAKEGDMPNQIIENALNKYFQMVTINNSFDLNKINEVKNYDPPPLLNSRKIQIN